MGVWVVGASAWACSRTRPPFLPSSPTPHPLQTTGPLPCLPCLLFAALPPVPHFCLPTSNNNNIIGIRL